MYCGKYYFCDFGLVKSNYDKIEKSKFMMTFEDNVTFSWLIQYLNNDGPLRWDFKSQHRNDFNNRMIQLTVIQLSGG